MTRPLTPARYAPDATGTPALWPWVRPAAPAPLAAPVEAVATPETLLAYLEAAEARAAAPTASRDGTTVREGILLALASLGDGPVAIPALVVRAWEREPERFGLAGYADRHPDAGKVQAKLCGRDGIVERGWCTRTGTGELTLTAKGRRHAASLAPAMGGAL